MLYIVEVVNLSRIVTKVLRTTDYDFALAVFDIRKKLRYREVRMVRVDNGNRTVLKYVDLARK